MSDDERSKHYENQLPNQRLGDAPIEDQYYAQMKAIVQVLDETLNGKLKGQDRTTGFILMVFPFNNHSGRCNYMSNGAKREDVVTLMKEQIARFEGQPAIKGNA